MSVIYDLREKENSWANSVNKALSADWPEYLEKNGAVGSDLWWQNYDAGTIPYETEKGIVTFIGQRVDQFDEEYDTVEIDLEGKLVEYDGRFNFFNQDEIPVGTFVKIESFQICVNQKYGPTTFKFERLIEIS